jgi:hypothetical protein
MISNTTLATLMARDADSPNLQSNLFLQANIGAPHSQPHVNPPNMIDGHGRNNPLFLNDGH